MKQLRKLKDNQTFCFSVGGIVYTLNRLDRNKREATYTSNSSGKTFIKDWHKLVHPLN